MVLKVMTGIRYIVSTIYLKLKCGNLFSIEGLLKKRKDTQIIITKNGEMKLGTNISFQRNVSLSSCMGGYIDYW